MHGGDIYSSKVNMDYSVNINPLGTPEAVKKAVTESVNIIDTYPQYESELLRERIAGRLCSHSDVKVEKENIICGNGASELITAVVTAFRPGRVLIPLPAFSGYARALRGIMKEECELLFYYLKEEDEFEVESGLADSIRAKSPEMVFITNPCNPTGRLISEDVLSDIINACREIGALLFLDECFIELSGSKGSKLTYEKMIILRAFTKLYAMPGIRLGFLIADRDIIKTVSSVLPEWNISIPAQRAGLAALEETEYVDRAVSLIKKERSYICDELASLGIKTYRSDANYICLFINKSEDACSLYDYMLKHGILIRDCSDYEGMGRGFYRVAVKSHDENRLLIKHIRAYCAK